MTINLQQREAYRQALEAWKFAARDAQSVKDRLYNAPTNQNDMYIMTHEDLQRLKKEHEHYQRLENAARNI